MTTEPPPPEPPQDQGSPDRAAVLDRALQGYAKAGWRTENRTATQATICKGKRPSHVLHLILSIITLGVWLIVWLIIGIFGGEKRRLVTVTDAGNVTVTKV